MRNRNLIIVLSVVAIITIVTLLFTSYGYISDNVLGNETAKRILFKRSSINIEYSGGTEDIDSEQNDTFVAGTTISKTFKLKNTGTEKVSFNINLINVINTFNRKQDIIYELYLNDKLIKTDIFPSESNIYIANNQIIGENEEKNYELKIKYLKSFENQIEDNGKVLKAKINFEETF